MSSRDFDPLQLDVGAFAKAEALLEGRWPLASLERMRDSVLAAALPPGGVEIAWQARGERRALRGGEHQVWLHLSASTSLPLECQRCLQAVEVPLAVSRSFLFVHGEEAAAQLDTDSEDDVLALTRALDLRELVEDELLLGLPLVPRHEVCPKPLPLPGASDFDEALADKPNPFAALATLKRGGLPN